MDKGRPLSDFGLIRLLPRVPECRTSAAFISPGSIFEAAPTSTMRLMFADRTEAKVTV
jgi:hypothetical protein